MSGWVWRRSTQYIGGRGDGCVGVWRRNTQYIGGRGDGCMGWGGEGGGEREGEYTIYRG